MSFNVSMLITANAEQAKRELKGAVTDVQAVGAAGRAAGASVAEGMKVAEAQIATLTREIGTLRSRLDAAAAAERQTVAQMVALQAKVNELEAAFGRGRGPGAGGVNGAVGNLIYQFNDVGTMLAAGQSPLLLAVQQGPQITQALGSAGAAGAVRMLGQAFLGMLNPVNFAVFAAIAALGILGNGLRNLGGETKTVEDALGDLEDATKSWRDAASVGLADLKRDFGSISPELVELQNRITALKLTEMLLDAAAAARTLGKELNPGFFELDSRQGNIADLLGKDQFAKRTARSVTVTPEVAEFERQMATLRNSSNLDEQITALERMQTLLVASAGGIGKMNEEQRVFYDQTLSIERALQAAKAAQEGVGSAQQAARNSAVDMLVSLRDEANIRQLITFHGEKSREVAEARVEAERRAFEATLQTLDVSSTLKDSLREAWDAANGMQGSAGDVAMALLDAAGAGDETKRAVADAWDLLTGAADATNVWASAMSGVAAEVRAIGSALGAIGKSGIANASKQVELEALKAGKSVADARRAAQTDEAQRDFDTNQKKVGYALANAKLQEDLRGIQLDADLQAARKVATERDRLTKGSGGGSKKTASGDRLIGSLERELDLLRETDPVQKEMIRNREALANATAAERAQVEDLIRVKLKEEAAQKQAKEAWDFAKSSAYDALEALIIQGDKASDVMANLASQIAKAFLQSALLGTGPLAGLFGGSGGGLFGGLGSLLGGGDLFANIGGLAEGGDVVGPGGPRDDAVLSWLSNGEYVVNADATARHRPLLEAINRAPRFATGGGVGSGSYFPAFAPSGVANVNAPGNWSGRSGGESREPMVLELRLTDDLDARIASTSERVSVKVVRAGFKEHNAKELPRLVQAINRDPRKVG